MKIIDKFKQYGLIGFSKLCLLFAHKLLSRKYYLFIYRNASRYQNPNIEELRFIENVLVALGVNVESYGPHPDQFKDFLQKQWFPAYYHGGYEGGVWDEKLLEHWISSELLCLHEFEPADIYVDVAAASSPWAKILRDKLGFTAFAIDLGAVPDEYRGIEYYRQEDATNTSFQSDSVRGISLHCAYEMFSRDDDILLIAEISRILRPGGKAVILPLYMHTHYCSYSSPEYFGKSYCDPNAHEYIHVDCWGIPSSRKYDAINLKSRVLDAIDKHGMKYRLRVLRNKNDFGKNVYCHFILEIEK